ncbi:hypothetical protein NP493_124g03015 [Ridgeia piscesae]|uniref:Sugar phosphate exchanger 3 n=1 Tax=Ridgeia piscesae TaxID=27915 RepID=A0AAD9P5W9_RIDPI|nr:hypothetical protein NP493_124g03015 [Ridgeia piscesae]
MPNTMDKLKSMAKSTLACGVTICKQRYAFFHATRKTFSNVKEILQAEWTSSFHNDSFNQTKPDDIWNNHHLFESPKVAEDFLGVLDTVFMFAYAVVFMFGTVSEWLHLYSITYYVILWIINGLLQSTGWPAMVAVMGNWFGRSSRGFILGLWSACASVGNIIGTLMASSVLHYGYQYVFLVTSAALFGWGIVIFFALVPSPTELGMDLPDTDHNSPPVTSQSGGHTEEAGYSREDSSVEDHPPVRKEEKAVGFFRAVLLPGVIPFVNYAFFFWLPLYLTSAYHWTQTAADEISIWYDVGGIVGSPNDRLVNALLMSVVGFFIGGPASLISAAISADLGRGGPIEGNDRAMATVTGIIDGSGWHWVFYIFIMMTLCTLVCILPVLVREVKNLQCWRSRYGQSGLTINVGTDDPYESDAMASDPAEPIST